MAGHVLYAADDRLELRVLDEQHTAPTQRVPLVERASLVEADPSGKLVAFFVGDHLRVIDASSSAVLLNDRAEGLRAVRFVTPTKLVAVLADGAKARVTTWSLSGSITSTSVALSPEVAARSWVGPVAISPDGTRFASVVNERIEIFDATTGRVLAQLEHASGGSSPLAFVDNTRLVAARFEDALLWKVP